MPQKEQSAKVMMRRSIASIWRDTKALGKHMDKYKLTLDPEDTARVDEVLRTLVRLMPPTARPAGMVEPPAVREDLD